MHTGRAMNASPPASDPYALSTHVNPPNHSAYHVSVDAVRTTLRYGLTS